LVLDFRLNDDRDLKICCAGGLPVHDDKSPHLFVWPRRLARRSRCLESPESRFIFNIYKPGAIDSSGLGRPQNIIAALGIQGDKRSVTNSRTDSSWSWTLAGR
jgi:hypothetical protein